MNKEFVHCVFEQQVIADPDAVAIEYASCQETYGRLNQHANRIAHVLHSIIPAQTVVAVLLDSSIAYIQSILGILKAGAVFMPLDRQMPARRLQYMLQESRAVVLVTSEAYLPEAEKFIDEDLVRFLVVLSDDLPGIAVHTWKNGKLHEMFLDNAIKGNETNLPLLNNADDGNYIFFTSGSTGTPKGILGKHISLAHFINWEIKELAGGQKLKVSQLTPITFDPSLRDIFVPLCSGGTLCIPDRKTREDYNALLNWLNSAGITLMHTVPSVFRILTKSLAAMPDPSGCLSYLKYVLLAGEPLYGHDIVNWYRLKASQVQLLNLYGPTETTLAKFFYRINNYNEFLNTPAVNVPVGKPISNTVEILLENGTLCSPGVVGEVYIKTPFMSNGYLNASLNEKAFIQNPLHNDFSDIVYKTGDLGRYLPDGNIELVGRVDFQVKINGVRIEIEEIEHHIRNFEKIEQAVIIVKETQSGEKKLACFYVKKEHFDEHALKDYLGMYLPGTMMPAYFIELKEMPLLLNGKIDKKALPDPVVTNAAAYEAPATDTEQRLLDIWRVVFTLDRISVLDSFINLGGNSLNAIQIMTKINGTLHANIRLGDILKLTTIRNIAAEIDKRKGRNGKRIEPLTNKHFYELSFLQKNYWLGEQMSDQDSAFIMAGAYLLQGALDKEALSKALRTVVERHEILRTVFLTVEGELKQVVREWDRDGYALQYADLRQTSITAQGIQQLADEEAKKAFDLENGPLFRTRLIQLQEDRYLFLLTMHHIIADGWSVAILINEILLLYNSYRAGLANPLKPLRVQYKDFAAWHNARLKNGVANEERRFWLNKFDKLPAALRLPSDFPRPVKKTYKGDKISITIDQELTTNVRQFCKTHQISLFVMVTTALKTLLYKYTGQEDIVVGTAVAGRDHPDLEGQVGLYTNNLALRTMVNGRESFLHLLQTIHKNVLDSLNYQSYPFDLLIDDLKIQRDFGRSPLFDVLVVVQNFDSMLHTKRDLAGLHVQEITQHMKVSKFDLSFIFWEDASCVFMDTEYNTDMFQPETAAWLQKALVNILTTAIHTPTIPLSDPALL